MTIRYHAKRIFAKDSQMIAMPKIELADGWTMHGATINPQTASEKRSQMRAAAKMRKPSRKYEVELP